MTLYNFGGGLYRQRETTYLAEKSLADVNLIRLKAPREKSNAINAFSPNGLLPIFGWYAHFSLRSSVPTPDYPPPTKKQHALALDLMGQTGIRIQS